MRTKLQFLLNFNEGQTDQDFRGSSVDANKHFDNALNEAYRDECKWLRGVSRSHFRRTFSFTWTADATTMPIPLWARDAEIEAVRDDTDESPGALIFSRGPNEEGSGFYRADGTNWGWTPAPSSERTLTMVYIAAPSELQKDVEEPDLLPSEHHDLLVWAAGILLKTIADEDVPRRWIERHAELRFLAQKAVSLGNPRTYPAPRITNNNRSL